MKKSGWRLALGAVLFVCWIGYLAFLAATTTEPIVLSRPQFLAADLYIVAQVPPDPANAEEPAHTVTVKTFIWSANPNDKGLKSLRVKDMVSMKQLIALHEKSGKEITDLEKKFVWNGAGDYILPLSHLTDATDLFTVTALPRTPGYFGAPGRIYPANPLTLRQLELIVQEYHPGK